MDHLTTGGRLLMPSIQVPYYSDYTYDHLDFATFPERQGFTKEGVFDIDRPCRELKAFLQTWLYFGLIEVFYRKKLKICNFVRTKQSQGLEQRVVHSETLDKTLSRAAAKFGPDGRHFEERLALADSLEIARQWITVLDRRATDDQEMVIIVFSIQVLIATLARWFDFPTVVRHEDEQSNSTQLLRNRLLDAGWCINQTHHVLRTNDWFQLYQLTMIRRQKPADGGESHDACSVQQCVTYKIDQRTYQTRHIEDGCHCDLLEAPFDRIHDIVQRGGTPLIDMRALGDEQLDLKVVEWTSSSSYTAISHLWTDGLGNFHDNSLPRCQLRKLSRRLVELKAKQRFRGSVTAPWSGNSLLMWMDTLCMPITQPQPGVPLRIKAIDQLPWIYTGANEVLVLDGELQCIEAEAEPHWQLQARIDKSRWNTRSWALVERYMAQNLFFQFQRSIVSAREVDYSKLSEQEPLSIRQKVFATAWNVIGRRSLTETEDTHLVLASLLGFSAVQIMSIATPATRTKSMLDAVGYFPVSMLWNSDLRPDAACDHPYRWIPTVPGPYPLTKPTMLLRRTNKGLQLGSQDQGLESPSLRHRILLKTKSIVVMLWRLKLPSAPKPAEDFNEELEEKPQVYLVPHGTNKARFWFSQKGVSGGRIWFDIRCDLPTNDRLKRNEMETACLIIEPTRDPSTPFFRGARLSVVDDEPRLCSDEDVISKIIGEKADGKNLVYAAYDCPITCRTSSSPPTWQQVTSVQSILRARELPSDCELVIKHQADENALRKMSRRGPDPRVAENVIYLYLPIGIIAVGCWWGMTAAIENVNSFAASALQDVKPFAAVGIVVVAIILSLLWWLVTAPIVRWRNRRAFRKWRGTYSESWV